MRLETQRYTQEETSKTKPNKTKLTNLGSVASYNIRPENGLRLF